MTESLEPSPAELGDTMTVTPGEWTPIDDHGTEIYLYGDRSADIAVQTAEVDDEVRHLRAAFDEIDRLLDEYRGAKALREGVRAAVERSRAFPGPRALDCRDEAARSQPHAMVNDQGDVFYPDGEEDARWLAEEHGAWPLDAAAFPFQL